MHFLDWKALCAKKAASVPVDYDEATRSGYHERKALSLGADSCTG